MILEKINSPEDLKQLTIEEMTTLSSELREALMHRLSLKGGHNGPNLGMVEMTIALHKVFNSPVDKLVFDVSHQTYIHKMLTGRRESFTDQDKFDLITGYTDPQESEHDHFTIGHTSTSISLGHGMAIARDLKGDKENIIAIIGDGSLSGGLALEGLSNAGELDSNYIIVVNDNDQSIAENHGGLYKNLRELRETKGKADINLFKAMGLDYIYLDEGHDIEKLIEVFEKVKDTQKPIVVHIHTIKGKGFLPAEQNREKFHAGGPIDLEKGDYKFKNTAPTYSSKIADLLKKEMDKDKTISFITAGTPSILNFDYETRQKYGKQFIDVGIAEEHATTMASAMAKNGAKPVFGVVSTFIQRAYDQISHDIGINNNPVTILVYISGIYGMNDVTHLGFYDIPMINNIPNIIYLSPTNLEEQIAMTKYAIHQNEHPIAIRVPVGPLVETGVEDKTDYSKLNKYEVTQKGEDVVIIGVGNFYKVALDAANIMKEKYNIKPTIINPKFTSGIDEELLDELTNNNKLLITLEDGQLEGGFGQMISSYLGDKGIKVKNLGIKKQFIDKFNPIKLMEDNGLLPEQIAKYASENK